MARLFPDIWEAGPVPGMEGVLAHQGGWDEALVVIVPVGLLLALLWVAFRRADDQDGPRQGDAGGVGDGPQGDGDGPQGDHRTGP